MGIVGRFEEAVTGNHKVEFTSSLFDALLICTFIAFQKAAILYFKGRCALRWREELVKQQHDTYFNPKVFSNIHCQKKIVGVSPQFYLDNPDQRLSQDTDRLTLNLSEFVTNSVTLPGKIIFYSWALSNLFGWFAPACCFGFFLLGSIPNLILLHRVVPALIDQEKLEGNFRHCHSEIRNGAESISFYRGSHIDNVRATRSLNRLVQNQHKVLCRQLPLNIVVQLCDYLGSVANYGILGLGILYLATAEGKTPSQIAGLLGTGSYACMSLIHSFTSVFDLSNYAADIVAYGRRVQEMFDFEDSLDESVGNDGGSDGGSGSGSGSGSDGGSGSGGGTGSSGGGSYNNNLTENLFVNVRDVTLRSPPSSLNYKGKILVQHLDIKVKQGEHVLLRGESGVGKSTLLRAMAHIGNVHVAGITVNIPSKDITFVPQSPFMFTGTLNELLSYPYSSDIVFEIDKNLLVKYIQLLDLSGILKVSGGWNKPYDWATLSPGEQQRIALIRLMMRPPKLAILDESFTNIDSEMVDQCLKLLKQMNNGETTCIFVSHSKRLHEFVHRSGGQTIDLVRHGEARELLPQ
jgi:ABC-type uncharacterized transport system fused permease/ATPase subunit